MRYIYFEVHRIDSDRIDLHPNVESTIQNFNVLLFPPDNLNSKGVWGFRHNTNQHRIHHLLKDKIDYITHLIVDQYWVDVEVYSKGDDSWVDIALTMLRDPKIDLIVNI